MTMGIVNQIGRLLLSSGAGFSILVLTCIKLLVVALF